MCDKVAKTKDSKISTAKRLSLISIVTPTPHIEHNAACATRAPRAAQ